MTPTAVQLVKSGVSVQLAATGLEAANKLDVSNLEYITIEDPKPRNSREDPDIDWDGLTAEQHDFFDGSLSAYRSFVTAPPKRSYDCVFLNGPAKIHCLNHLISNNMIAENGLVLISDFERKWYSTAQLWLEVVDKVDRLAVFKLKLS